MSEQIPNPFEPFFEKIREIVREEIKASNGHAAELLTPENLADRLKVPVSWVYEQSRQGKIPTHRLGRYIRFDLAEVIASQKKADSPSFSRLLA
jgi:excisionase family DNA binding protein